VKKIFKLTDPKKHEDRVLESIKHEIRKYIKREKKKSLSDAETMYWDFDCRVGASEPTATAIEIDKLIKSLDSYQTTDTTEIYVEILVKEVAKPAKVEVAAEEKTEDAEEVEEKL